MTITTHPAGTLTPVERAKTLIIAALAGVAAACATPSVLVPDAEDHHGDATPWTSLAVLDGPERFAFAVVSDNTGGPREGVFEIGVEALNRVQPAFVMSVGDLIQGYTEDAAQIESEWDEFDGFVEELDAPFFYVAGNHDMMNQPMEDAWTARFGASYYHFVYKDTLFLVLNSELMDINPDGPDKTRGPGHDAWHDGEARRAAGDAQMTYAENVLAAHTDVRWTFVFLHKPFWREGWVRPPRVEGGDWNDLDLSDYPVDGPYPTYHADTADWVQMTALLADRDYTAFAGHRHSYDYEAKSHGPHTHETIALATTGGVSNLRGPSYGEFDHVAWVTMTEDGPVIANILLDGVLAKDLETPDARPWFVD